MVQLRLVSSRDVVMKNVVEVTIGFDIHSEIKVIRPDGSSRSHDEINLVEGKVGPVWLKIFKEEILLIMHFSYIQKNFKPTIDILYQPENITEEQYQSVSDVIIKKEKELKQPLSFKRKLNPMTLEK